MLPIMMLNLQDVDEHVVLLSIPMRLALTDRSLKNPALADPNSPPDVRLAANLLAEMELGLASPWHPFVQARSRLPPQSLHGNVNFILQMQLTTRFHFACTKTVAVGAISILCTSELSRPVRVRLSTLHDLNHVDRFMEYRYTA